MTQETCGTYDRSTSDRLTPVDQDPRRGEPGPGRSGKDEILGGLKDGPQDFTVTVGVTIRLSRTPLFYHCRYGRGDGQVDGVSTVTLGASRGVESHRTVRGTLVLHSEWSRVEE